MGLDYDHLGAIWATMHHALDHSCFNSMPGLENPTSEGLADWLWKRLKQALPALSWVSVYETATAGCHYHIWKEQRFESTLRLLRAPNSISSRRLHGHSYLLRLHLTAPLDEVMGWVLDYLDVKERFRPVYKQLDHHLLNELSRLGDADPASLALWLREDLLPGIPQLDRIDLHQTPGCGALLCWGEQGPALPA